MIGELYPGAGRLLLAEPFMLDPNFMRSVVYLTEHNEVGSVGFVLNQPSALMLTNLIDDINVDFPVYIGGPVEHETLHFLHREGDRLEGAQEISKGVYWGGNFEILKILLNDKQFSQDDIRFFLGYSGWTQGQLEDEMHENAWMVAEPTADFIFHPNSPQLWADVVKSMGKKYEHIVHFPENPNLN